MQQKTTTSTESYRCNRKQQQEQKTEKKHKKTLRIDELHAGATALQNARRQLNRHIDTIVFEFNALHTLLLRMHPQPVLHVRL
jgi:hypothetical protein